MKARSSKREPNLPILGYQENANECLLMTRDVFVYYCQAIAESGVHVNVQSSSVGEHFYPSVEIPADLSNRELKRLERFVAKHHRAFVKRMRAMSYQDYLKTDVWQARRAIALHRADYACQVCNSTKQLDVHHRTYERLGEESFDDLLVLCRNCHQIFHENGKLVK